MSPLGSSLWHVKGSCLRETFPRRYALPRTQAYFFAWRKHYSHRRLCEHGLSSTFRQQSSGSEDLNVIEVLLDEIGVDASFIEFCLKAANAVDVGDVRGIDFRRILHAA